MNKPVPDRLLQPAQAFADYQANTAARIDEVAELAALDTGTRVGVSRPHESAHLHVAGEADYIDDLPELAGTLQPRIEPEVTFGIAATPPEGATLEQLFACVDWLAPSFEVVQSHLPGWKFASIAEPVADGGLHARLLVGRKTPVRSLAASGAALNERLAEARLKLFCGDALVDEGQGRNVLDGPLHALLHFVHELQRCEGAPPLAAGDVVTTGTWTDAWPIEPGQTWRTRIDAPLDALEIVLRGAPGAQAA